MGGDQCCRIFHPVRGGSVLQNIPSSDGGSMLQNIPSSEGGSVLQNIPSSEGGSVLQNIPSSEGGSVLQNIPSSEGLIIHSPSLTAPAFEATAMLSETGMHTGTIVRILLECCPHLFLDNGMVVFHQVAVAVRLTIMWSEQ